MCLCVRGGGGFNRRWKSGLCNELQSNLHSLWKCFDTFTTSAAPFRSLPGQWRRRWERCIYSAGLQPLFLSDCSESNDRFKQRSQTEMFNCFPVPQHRPCTECKPANITSLITDEQPAVIILKVSSIFMKNNFFFASFCSEPQQSLRLVVILIFK